MIYVIYIFFIFLSILLIDYKIPIKLAYSSIEFVCNNFFTKHLLKMMGVSLLNIGNAALFFSMSGYLVSSLGIAIPDLTMLVWYGIIMTVSGYILGNCKKIEK